MDCFSYKPRPALPGVCGLGAGAPLILSYSQVESNTTINTSEEVFIEKSLSLTWPYNW